MKHKRYDITNFEQLLNVLNEDNFVSLSTDLIQWLSFNMSLTNKLREKNPKATEGKSNWEILNASFVWIDDGKTGMTRVELTNKGTGEKQVIKLKKK